MEHRQKIALVVSHPIQHFCPQYASFAQNENIEFKVFFASALGFKKYHDPNFKREISWGNLNLDHFPHIFLNGDQVLPSNKDLDAPTLDAELERFTPDVVIIYGYFQKLQRRAHRWAKNNKCKLAYISDSELRQKRNPVKEFVKYFFVRNYFSAIDYFLSVGDANEEFYRHYGVDQKKILRMHFPIDVRSYEKSFADRNELRRDILKKYGINDSSFVISVVGKLAPWKNQDHAIDALALLEAKGIIIELLIVGSGGMESAWMEKAKRLKQSKVHFTGFVDPETLPGYYAASNAYVHPASVEPHSIAVSEAIFMGLPVVISDRCGSYGPSDDVQPNQNGFVYPFKNINALAESIEHLYSDRKLCSEFGLRSHENAIRFQNQSHVGVLEQLRKKLLGD